jgi:Ca2+-binding RTX toxin-like protein
MFAFMVMLAVRPAAASCDTGTTCRTTSGSGSYCAYDSGDDSVFCHVEGSGANTLLIGGSGSAWDVTVTDPGGSICCDTSDFGSPAADLLASFYYDCSSGPSSCVIDLTALDVSGGPPGGVTVGALTAGDDEFYGSETGAGDHDTVYAGDGDDYLYGGLGGDTLAGEGGRDYIDGGGGPDEICAGDLDSGGFACLEGSGTNTSAGCNDILLGGPGNDRLIGSSESGFGCVGDYMDGEGGEDELEGKQGNDTLCGGTTNEVDDLDGGPGNDYLYGGPDGPAHGDVQVGGGGNDRCENDGTPAYCESPSRSYPFTTLCPAVPDWP